MPALSLRSRFFSVDADVPDLDNTMELSRVLKYEGMHALQGDDVKFVANVIEDLCGMIERLQQDLVDARRE